jgi:hypothetical protein
MTWLEGVLEGVGGEVGGGAGSVPLGERPQSVRIKLEGEGSAGVMVAKMANAVSLLRWDYIHIYTYIYMLYSYLNLYFWTDSCT